VDLSDSPILHASTFLSLPEKRYSYLKLHTHFSEGNAKVLEDSGINPVITIRDLRDMMISRYFHIMQQSSHWQHDSIKNLDFSDGLLRSLLESDPEKHHASPIEIYSEWILGWMGYINTHPEKSILIRYEDMKGELNTVIERLFDYFEIDNSELLSSVIEKQGKIRLNRGKGSLKDNLAKPGRAITTFRKGEIGEWKTCFDQSHKDVFKEKGSEALIVSGYEKDLNW
jgi:hypothetical protein